MYISAICLLKLLVIASLTAVSLIRTFCMLCLYWLWTVSARFNFLRCTCLPWNAPWVCPSRHHFTSSANSTEMLALMDPYKFELIIMKFNVHYSNASPFEPQTASVYKLSRLCLHGDMIKNLAMPLPVVMKNQIGTFQSWVGYFVWMFHMCSLCFDYLL